MNRGFVALAEGKYDEAYENFQSVTKLNPENSSVSNHNVRFLTSPQWVVVYPDKQNSDAKDLSNSKYLFAVVNITLA